ncbi:MAG: hypothetical protein WD794_13165 [Mycobacteriales bacterium]
MSGGAESAVLDPAGIVAALERHQVRYVIIGGVAAQLHGSPAPTRGLDLTPERSAPNLARLAAALASVEAQEWVPGFGYPLQLPMDRRRLAGDRVLLSQTRYGRVDVVPAPHGVPDGYDELDPRARRVSAYGRELPVACLDDLVRSHGAASRAKDKLALARLIDLRLGSQERSLPPHLLRPAASLEPPAPPTLHDALAASERLAAVFDDIRPQLAYVRRELYRAVDSVMYGDAASTRDAIDRAHHAASNAQADVRRLRGDFLKRPGEITLTAVARNDDPGSILTNQADQELRAALRLLTSTATQPQGPHQDEARDRLIEARVHVATADNHLDLLQIQLEHLARGWERDARRGQERSGRE